MTVKTELFKHAEGGQAFTAGQTIFKQGDEPRGLMYVVQEGTVDITSNGKLIETIGPGSFLGEIGLVASSPRSATAVAREPSKLVAIDEAQFLRLVRQTPNFALQVMRAIAERLLAYRG
jgi:CRP-like cAMP-binding protein